MANSFVLILTNLRAKAVKLVTKPPLDFTQGYVRLFMSKYKLNFSCLNSNSDVKSLEFTSSKKRADFIADRVIGAFPKRIFTVVINYSEPEGKHIDVYVFENWSCIQDVVQSRWRSFYLFEWNSFEEAYKNALDLQENSKLCYS